MNVGENFWIFSMINLFAGVVQIIGTFRYVYLDEINQDGLK